jgi:GNAT superfamily N-acetyltransferase
VVGWGSLEQRPFNHEPGKYWIEVVVDPGHRHHGLGRLLYDQLEGEAVRRGARGLWATARVEDPSGLAFFRHQGFVERRRVWRSRLNLADANLAALGDRTEALPRAGIRFTTLAQEGADQDDVRRRYYAVQSAAGRDVPTLGSHGAISYEQFLRFEFDDPGFLPEATFFAESGGRYVGVTALDRVRRMPGELHVGFTGVLPEFRGQGIAVELKRRSIHFARELGYRTMRTSNDSLNRPIWSINERLGFRPVETQVHGEKSLGSAGPRDSVEGADRA